MALRPGKEAGRMEAMENFPSRGNNTRVSLGQETYGTDHVTDRPESGVRWSQTRLESWMEPDHKGWAHVRISWGFVLCCVVFSSVPLYH